MRESFGGIDIVTDAEKTGKAGKKSLGVRACDQVCFRGASDESSQDFVSFGGKEDDDEDEAVEEEARVDGDDLDAKEGREFRVKDPALGDLLIEGGLRGLVAESDVEGAGDGDGEREGDGN